MTPVPDAYEIIERTATYRVHTFTNKLRLSTPYDIHHRVLGQLLQCVRNEERDICTTFRIYGQYCHVCSEARWERNRAMA